MSCHIFKTHSKGRRVSVVLGYDRTLKNFYLMVQHLNSATRQGKRRSARDTGPAFLYTNTSDPNAGSDLGYYWEKLEKLGISVPARVFREADRDAEYEVGNRVVQHYASGKRVVLARNRRCKRP